MKKIHAAICDEEDLYCSQLLKYLQEHKRESFEIAVFSDKESLKKALDLNTYQIVLMTEDFFCKDIVEQYKVIFVVFGDGSVSKELEKYPRICKCQPVQAILRDISKIAELYFGEWEPRISFNDNKKVYAFYSPHHDCVQIYLTMAYARILSTREKVLYINLMDCAGFEDLFQETYKENLGDFLYYLRKGETNLKLHFESMIYRFGNVDYLPPVLFGEILGEAEAEDYQNMLSWLIKETAYETIILDFGGMIQGFFQLLMCCKKVFCLTREDFASQGRYNHFKKCMELAVDEGLKEKLKTIAISKQCEYITQKEDSMQPYAWDEWRDYVQKQVMEEEISDGGDI